MTKVILRDHINAKKLQRREAIQFTYPTILKIHKFNSAICDSLTIYQIKPGTLKISTYKNNQLTKQNIIQRGENYTLKDGWIFLKGLGEGGINRDGVVGLEISKTSITRDELGNLILREKGGGLALAFFIPFAGVGQVWMKFERLSNKL